MNGEPSEHPAPLVALIGNVIVAVDASGDPLELFRFGEDPHVGVRFVGSRALAVRGRYAAAGVTWRGLGPDDPETVLFELTLIDLATRAVRVSHVEEVPYENWGGGFDLFGNADGLFVYGLRLGDFTRMGVISPEWTATLPITDFTVATDPDYLGNVGVRRIRNVDVSGGPNSFWLSLCTMDRTPMLVQSPRAVVAQRVIGGTESGLIFESAMRTDVLAPGNHRGRSMTLSPSHVLLVETEERGVYRSHVPESGTMSSFRIRVPDGFRRMHEGASGDPTILDLSATEDAAATSDGRLLLAFRDDRVAHVFETSDGRTWASIGSPVGQVYDARGREVAGTYLLFGDTNAVDVGPWPTGVPDRLDGHTVQLVRPASGVAIVLDQTPLGQGFTRHYQVTADGRCVAWLTGTTLHVVSATTGVKITRDFASVAEASAAGSYSDQLTWAEGSRVIVGP